MIGCVRWTDVIATTLLAVIVATLVNLLRAILVVVAAVVVAAAVVVEEEVAVTAVEEAVVTAAEVEVAMMVAMTMMGTGPDNKGTDQGLPQDGMAVVEEEVVVTREKVTGNVRNVGTTISVEEQLVIHVRHLKVVAVVEVAAAEVAATMDVEVAMEEAEVEAVVVVAEVVVLKGDQTSDLEIGIVRAVELTISPNVLSASNVMSPVVLNLRLCFIIHFNISPRFW